LSPFPEERPWPLHGGSHLCLGTPPQQLLPAGTQPGSLTPQWLDGHCTQAEARRLIETRHVPWLVLPRTSPPYQEDDYEEHHPQSRSPVGPGSGPHQPAGSAPSKSPTLNCVTRINIIMDKALPQVGKGLLKLIMFMYF